jgi:hypothetical protein
MNYIKPEITALVSANSAIQGSNPLAKESGSFDQAGTQHVVTIPAYEGDE